MKKLIGYLLIFLLGVAGTLAYIAWHDRQQSREEPALSLEAAQEVRDDLIERAERARQRDGSSSLVVTEADLKAMVILALARHPQSEDLMRMVRDVEARIAEDSLGIGFAVDLEALERSGLADAQMLNRILDMLPFLRGQELALAVRGTPGVRDGKIALVDELEVTLAFLTLPVDAFEDRLGLSAERLYSQLVFDVDWFVIEEVQAREGELTLEVRARK